MFRHDDYFSMRMVKKASDNTNALLHHDSVFEWEYPVIPSSQCAINLNAHCAYTTNGHSCSCITSMTIRTVRDLIIILVFC